MIQTVDNYYLSDLVYKSKKEELVKHIKDTKNYYALFNKNFSSNDKKVIGEKIDILSEIIKSQIDIKTILFSLFSKMKRKKLLKMKMI